MKKEIDPPKKLYTIKQLAEILQVIPNHIYIMCRRGDIPYINIGNKTNRRYRFDLDDVKDFLKGKR